MIARASRAVGLGLALALAGSACPSSPPRAPSRLAASHAVVRIQSEVIDAGVWIDGAFIGAVGDLRGGVALDPGHHRLELRHEAYFVDYRELDLAAGQRPTLAIELAPLLP